VTRGDIVSIVTQGDYGKPRPAIIVQSNRLLQTRSVLVCPMTTTDSDTSDVRLTIQPVLETGLRTISFAMVDKVTAVLRRKCGRAIGRLPDTDMVQLDVMLALVMGLAG
jgi:mRNA interferase MazF